MMYNDLVKSLLKKHFGEPKKSLTVGDVSEPGDKAYYYSFGKEKEIAAIRDLLGMKHLVEGIDKLPELKQTFGDKDFSGDDQPQCVMFKEDDDGQWSAYFCKITGVVYHRTYGNRAAATLQIADFPFVTLSDRFGEFYGFWRRTRKKKTVLEKERIGFSYWMNKSLKTNARFRAFTVDFFNAVADEEHRFILKDVARTIENCGFFLPTISYDELIKYRTPAELIHSFEKEPIKLNVDFNKVDVNVGYVMVMLAPEVDKRDRKVLSKFDVKTVSDSVSLNLLYEEFRSSEFINWYYRKKFAGYCYDYDIRTYAEDYLQMCAEEGDKFRIGLSFEGLVRAHDELVVRNRLKVDDEELKLPLVAEPSKFDDLVKAISERGSSEFEHIRTTKRLYEEGVFQHNCVFSRREFVRNDNAAIYHWEHGGASYTIQFSVSGKGKYFVQEIRARFNQDVTEDHLADLKKILSGVCTVDGFAFATFFLPEDGVNLRLPGFVDDEIIEDELPF